MSFKLRDYQQDIVDRAVDIVDAHGFVYLAMEVRTGKTLTALSIAERVSRKGNVLFVTKKKAISSIDGDMKMMCAEICLFTINYESLHKLEDIKWDTIILDEAHSMGAFPKPSKRAKQVSQLLTKHKPNVILLSGTPTPESYSQMYHQVYGIPGNPFGRFKNFYRFCDEYVDIKMRPINGFQIKDYSNGRQEIIDKMNPYTISFTQSEAGFTSQIDEEVIYVDMKPSTYSLIERLKKDLVVEGKEEVILADTGVKLQSKCHQLFSGTIKFESGNNAVIDDTKAQKIKSRFIGNRIGIFYKFKAELKALKQVFGDELCEDVEKFDNEGYRVIALQIVSGREGISLRNAEYLIFYNIDFSATSYWQARDRMTTKDRSFNKVYWIFSRNGIEDQVYKSVVKKKDYTLKHFKKDFL